MRIRGAAGRGRIAAGARGMVVAAGLAAVVALGAPPASGAPTCAICATFVTTGDLDGPGPLPPRTRSQGELAANLPYLLDVDGTLPPAPAGLLPLLPGYEMRATVQALDAAKPTIRIERLLGVPKALALRIEAATLGDDGWASIGYDTLDSAAPESFVARVDRSNRDGNDVTDQALLDVTIAGPGPALTIVNEEFTGDPAGTRGNRSINRLRYVGDGKTRYVPRRVGIQTTTSDGRQNTILTRDLATRLELELVRPGGSRMTGTLDALPARAELTQTDLRLNGDEQLDKKVDLVASAPIPSVTLRTQDAKSATEVRATDFPSEVHLAYQPAPSRAEVDRGVKDQTKVSYDGNARTTKLLIAHEDDQRRVVADVDGLPSDIKELSATRIAPGVGQVVIDATDVTTRAELDVFEGAAHSEAIVEELPGKITLDHAAAKTSGRFHYVADGVAKRAALMVLDEDGRRTTVAADRIPSDVLVTHAHHTPGELDFDYVADGTVEKFEVHGTGYTSLPEGADRLDVVLEGVPHVVKVRKRHDRGTTRDSEEVPPPANCVPRDEDDDETCPETPRQRVTTVDTTDEALAVEVPGGQLGKADIHLSSGPQTRLPERADNGRIAQGLLVHDTAEGFVAHLRLALFGGFSRTRHLKTTTVTGPGAPTQAVTSQGTTTTTFGSRAGTHAFLLDLQSQPRPGAPVSTIEAMLAQLPGSVTLVEEHDDDTLVGRNITTWNAAESVPGYTKDDSSFVFPAFRLVEGVSEGETTRVDKELSLTPMPAHFQACQAKGELCSGGRFDANRADLAAGDRDTYRTFACALAGCRGEDFDVEPPRANRGSLGFDTGGEPSRVVYREGDWSLRFKPFVEIDLTGLTTFALQGHKVRVSCVLDQTKCQRGYVALDTGNALLTGKIHKGGGDGAVALMDFPAGFNADRLVWAFHESGPLSGRLATTGGLDCPTGTRIIFGTEQIDERFCNGDVLEGNIFNHLPGM